MCWVTNKLPIKLIAESDIPVKKYYTELINHYILLVIELNGM